MGFTPATATRGVLGGRAVRLLFGLIEDMVSTVRQIHHFMAAPAFKAACGGADGDAITHVDHRLMDYHERLLELTESCRSISGPLHCADVVADCARLLHRPLEGYRDFVIELVDVVEMLPKFLQHNADDVHLGAIALDVDTDEAPRLLKRLNRMAR